MYPQSGARGWGGSRRRLQLQSRIWWSSPGRRQSALCSRWANAEPESGPAGHSSPWRTDLQCWGSLFVEHKDGCRRKVREEGGGVKREQDKMLLVSVALIFSICRMLKRFPLWPVAQLLIENCKSAENKSIGVCSTVIHQQGVTAGAQRNQREWQKKLLFQPLS